MINYFPTLIAEAKARTNTTKSSIALSIPYSPQFMSFHKMDQWISGELDPFNDPLWKDSGATTKEEYEIWTRNGCGMACLQMILKYLKKKDVPLAVLGKLCESYGGYVKNGNTYDGLFYKTFCKFIQAEFKLAGIIAPFLSLKRIQYELSQGNLVIASVDSNIRDVNKKSQSKGGHLVIITGYDKLKKTISLNNPSGLYNKSQINYTISEKDFKRFFASRGIIIQSI